MTLTEHETIGERIKRLRNEQGLAALDLAQKLGTWQQTIYGWEAGKKISDPGFLPQLADILNTSIDYLLLGTDPAPKAVGQ